MNKSATIIETERLKLRTWELKDCEAYYNMNRDSRVIEFVKGNLTMDEVKNFIERQNTQQEKRGYAVWAAELKETGELIGFIGLNHVDWKASFTPAVEIAWRLGSNFWGEGYATEGARAALEYGFMKVGLKEIVAFTVPDNKRSSHVMEKIGLIRDLKGDFAHPMLEPNDRLSKHILYRLGSHEFQREKD